MSWVRRRGAPLRAGATARLLLCFGFENKGIGAVGKWKTCFWFSTFPSALVAGAVGMWESRLLVARFPRGSWKEWEARLWLSTLSTVPAFPQLCAGAVRSGAPGRSAKPATTASLRTETISAGEIACHLGSSDPPRREHSVPPTRVCPARSLPQQFSPSEMVPVRSPRSCLGFPA
jgi:hypothetical protein